MSAFGRIADIVVSLLDEAAKITANSTNLSGCRDNGAS
jgi:hypothetical protein